MSPLTKIAALSVAGVPPTVLGIIFALAPAPLYSFYVQAPRLWGLSALTDQQYGGVIMLGVGNIVYFIAVIVVFMRLFSDPGRDEEIGGRSHCRGDALMPQVVWPNPSFKMATGENT